MGRLARHSFGMQSSLLVEPVAVERLWREFASRLILYAASILADRAAAEDAVHAVFLRLLRAPGIPDSEAGFLFRAVRNESLDTLRSVRRASRAREHLFDARASDPRDEAELAEFRARVEAQLAALPDEQREVVVLKIWGDLTFPDIAAVLGTTEKTVEHRYYRALAALESRLK